VRVGGRIIPICFGMTGLTWSRSSLQIFPWHPGCESVQKGQTPAEGKKSEVLVVWARGQERSVSEDNKNFQWFWPKGERASFRWFFDGYVAGGVEIMRILQETGVRRYVQGRNIEIFGFWKLPMRAKGHKAEKAIHAAKMGKSMISRL